jgi:L-fuculose-phosphate aldolase
MIAGGAARVPEDVRRDILQVCRRAYERGLVAGTDGNVSVRLSKDRVVATPTGMCKGFLQADDLVVCDLDGNQLAGTRRLTTEIKIHLAAYAERDDVCAVVHAHPPYATAFAVAGTTPSEALMPEAYIAVGPVALAPYATPSTDALAASLRPAVAGHDAVLLANHGAMTLGRDVIGAYHRMEALEQLCRISCIAHDLGGAKPLTHEQTSQLEAIRGVYGTPHANVPCFQCGFVPDEGSRPARGGAAAAGYVAPAVHWPGNPPVWERPGFEPSALEAQVRDLARRELRVLRTARDD